MNTIFAYPIFKFQQLAQHKHKYDL